MQFKYDEFKIDVNKFANTGNTNVNTSATERQQVYDANIPKMNSGTTTTNVQQTVNTNVNTPTSRTSVHQTVNAGTTSTHAQQTVNATAETINAYQTVNTPLTTTATLDSLANLDFDDINTIFEEGEEGSLSPTCGTGQKNVGKMRYK